MDSSLKAWKAFKRFIETPNFKKAPTKWNIPGILLYAGCFGIAVALLCVILTADTAFLVKDYLTRSGNSIYATKHLTPDTFICPLRLAHNDYEFAALYVKNVIGKIGMKKEDVDQLARLYYNGCGKSKCARLRGKCSGRFKIYCDKVEAILDEMKGRNYERYHIAAGVEAGRDPGKWDSRKCVNIKRTCLGAPYVENETMDFLPEVHAKVLDKERAEGGGFDMELLWRSIIDLRYPSNKALVRKHVNQTMSFSTAHFYTNYAEDKARGLKYQMLEQEIWIDKTLCGYVPGWKMGMSVSPYTGVTIKRRYPPEATFHNLDHFRYWFGNVNNDPVTEATLVSSAANCDDRFYQCMPQRASVAYYAMTAFHEAGGSRLDCLQPANVRGAEITCDTKSWKKNPVTWYYDFSYGTRSIHTVWIYPNVVREIYQARVYTAYTMFQFLAGLFGASVGLSSLQITELALAALGSVRNIPKMIKLTRILIVSSITAFTIVITVIDAKSYVDNRYTKQFTQRPVQEFPFPMISLCDDRLSMNGLIDRSNLYRYNVSSELFAFMKKFVWNKYPGEIIAIAEQNITATRSRFVFKDGCIRNIASLPNNTFECEGTPVECENAKGRLMYPLRDHIYDLMAIKWGLQGELDVKFVPENWKPFEETTWEGFSNAILKEMEELARKLGLDENAPLYQFLKPFGIHSIIEIPKCKPSEGCSLHVDYNSGMAGKQICAVVRVKTKQPLIKKAGYLNGADILLNSPYNVRHSDRWAYLGPDTLAEEEKWAAKEMDRAKWSEKEIQDLKYGHCTDSGKRPHYGRAFELVLRHPDGRGIPFKHMMEVDGPRGTINSVLNLKITSESRIQTKTSNCTPPGTEVCLHPELLAMDLFRSIQFLTFCDCTYCSADNPEVSAALDFVMGRKIHCCNAKEALSCYASQAKGVKFNAELEKYDYTSDAGIAHGAMNIRNSQFATFTIQKLLKEGTTLFDHLFYLPHQLSPEIKERLKDFLVRCNLPRCEERGLTLATLQSLTPLSSKKDRFRIFFGKDQVEGVQETDVLHLAQFCGVLSCMYSVTFGISIVVGIEFLMLWFFRKPQRDQEQENLKLHLLKAFAAFFRKGPEPQGNQIAPIELNERGEGQNVEDDPEIAAASGEPRPKEIDQDHHKSTIRLKEGEEGDGAGDGSGESTNGSEDEEDREPHPMFGRIMMLALGVCVVSLAIMLATFYSTGSATSNSMVIVKRAYYPAPAIGLCAQNTSVERMKELLAASTCVRRGLEFPIRCYHVFNLVYAIEDYICAVLSAEPRMGQLQLIENDLEITTPREAEFLVWISGTNGSRVTEQSGNLQWITENITVTYALSLELDKRPQCSAEPGPDSECHRCGATIHGDGQMCCFVYGIIPGEVVDSPCFDYKYALYVSAKRSMQEMKRLTVKAKSEVLTVYVTQNRFSYVEHYAVVGGFLGIFTEITVLNILSGIFSLLLFAVRELIMKMFRFQPIPDPSPAPN